MMKQYFDLTLKDNIIVSQSSATAGQHQTLDYIPGSVFLGAAASSLYQALEAEGKAWDVFHSGLFRFGNATPLADGEATMPMPLALHTEKGARWKIPFGQNNCEEMLPAQVFSFIADTAAIKDVLKDKQPVQIRGGYLTDSGLVYLPQKHYEMKTAVSPDKNVAETEQLFGYESLKAGQIFRFCLEADSDDKDLFQRVVAALNGQIRVGRSRSAQFGRAICRTVDGDSNDQPTITNRISLLCHSDLALLSHCNQSTFTPSAADFGLPADWVLDISASFIRVRAYSPYNGKRRTYDCERQVISQGSVLTFEGTADLAVAARVRAGLYQEQGLGVLCPLPSWLSSVHVTPQQKPAAAEKQASKEVAKVDTALTRWLLAHQPAGSADDAWLSAFITALPELFDNARRLNGIPPSVDIGPSKSQWGNLYQYIRQHRHKGKAELLKNLFDKKQGICRVAGSDENAWGLRVMDSFLSEPCTFSDWLSVLLGNEENPAGCYRDKLPQPLSQSDYFTETLLALADRMKRDPSGHALKAKEVSHV